MRRAAFNRMSVLLMLFFASAAWSTITPGEGGGGSTCKQLTFKGGSISPGSVATGGAYAMSCNYGEVVDCVLPAPPSGACSFTGWDRGEL